MRAKSSRLLFLMWENSYTSQNKKKKVIADVRIPECTLGWNCTNKQADPGVHFLKRYVSWWIKKEKKTLTTVEQRLKPLPSKTEFEGHGKRRLVKKMFQTTFSPYPTMFSTIDGNCRHLRHINFLCLHILIQHTGMDREWVFTLPIFNKLVLTNIFSISHNVSTVDGNYRHLRHINFIRLHIQIQRTGMDWEWVFTLPIFNKLAQDLIST